jgi:hypothetical protein
MTKMKMFGIVALAATMMLGANCGGPVDPPDGGDGGPTDSGCEPNCVPDFTATVKAYAPVDGMVGKFELRLKFPNDGPIYATPTFTCENVSTCEFVVNKTKLESWDYENLVATKYVRVDFKPVNGLYVGKTVGLENGKTYDVRWGDGEGGADPKGRTYRCNNLGTFSNVHAALDETGTKVKLILGCGPFLTLTSFEGPCSDGRVNKGSIASDFSSLHVEYWRNGALEASCDAPVTR